MVEYWSRWWLDEELNPQILLRCRLQVEVFREDKLQFPFHCSSKSWLVMMANYRTSDVACETDGGSVVGLSEWR